MNFEIKKYKDGQVSALLKDDGDLNIAVRGSSYEDLFAVASVKEAWDNHNPNRRSRWSELTIYCLIGQRSDRRFKQAESFDLKVICNFINSMGFNSVKLFHPHSDVSLALIHKSEKISHFHYVQRAFEAIDNAVLISPDAGAYKATYEIAKQLNAELVPSNKVRIDGEPQLLVQGNVEGRNCLIVDDLADGGRTFKLLADELKKQGAVQVHLYVSHGQFNYGFEELKQSIDHVYCTNSFKDIKDEFVTQFDIL